MPNAKEVIEVDKSKYKNLVESQSELKQKVRDYGEANRTLTHKNQDLFAEARKTGEALDRARGELNEYTSEPTPALAVMSAAEHIAGGLMAALRPESGYNEPDLPMLQPADAVLLLEEVRMSINRMLQAARADVKDSLTYTRKHFSDRY